MSLKGFAVKYKGADETRRSRGSGNDCEGSRGRKYRSEFRETEMIYRNLNSRGRCVFLSLPLEQRLVSHRITLYLYTRACQNYWRVYLSFLHQRNDIGGLGRGRGEMRWWFQSLRREPHVPSWQGPRVVPHRIFNYSLYSRARRK